MTTIVFGGASETATDWTDQVYAGTVVREGKVVYLVSTSIVPTLFRGFTGGTDDGGYVQVYDGGIPIPRGPDYVDTTEMLAVAPATGTVRWCFNGGSWFRLGSVPQFELRVQAVGYASAAGAHIDSTYLLAEAGVTATTSGRLLVTARYVDDPSVTYLDLLNDAAISYAQAFGFNRRGEFEVLDIAPPTGDPVYTFTLDNVIDVERELPVGQPYPMWRLTYQCGETWPITEFAEGASSTYRDKMSRSPWYREWIHETPDTLDKHLLAAEVTLQIRQREPQNDFGWELLRDIYFDLIGVEREQVTVHVDFDGLVLQLDCNDVVRITMPRLGFDAGKLMRILVVRYDLARKRAAFTLWG